MGRMKDFAMKVQEKHIDCEYGTERFDFLFDVELCLSTTRKEPEAALKTFFYSIFGELNHKERIWTMTSTSDGLTDNLSFSSTEEALTALTALSELNYNLYYSPTIYTNKWRTNKNTKRSQTLFVDIDGMDESILSMSEAEIKTYLCATYQLTEEQLPNWITISGHGLHLYYLIEPLDLTTEEGRNIWALYTDYLITYFKADIACRNRSRILRFPTSKNAKSKDDIRQTRLLHLNHCTERNIDRLNCFAFPQTEIDHYIKLCNDMLSARRAETRAKNKALKEATAEQKNSTLEQLLIQLTTLEKEGTKQNKILTENTKKKTPIKKITNSHSDLNLKLYPMEAHTRYTRILRDLHNYAARRHGVPEGYRAIYTHLTAIYLKKVSWTEDYAKEYIAAYVDSDFLQEAYSIIEAIYNGKEYRYTNANIAKLLDFNEEDLKYSFANYTWEQCKKANHKKHDAYNAKRYADQRTERKKKQEERKEYIAAHWNEAIEEIAKKLSCSVRTVYYIRSKIKSSSTV